MSERNKAFIVNVAPSNKFMIQTMNKLGAEVAQISFLVPKA